MLTLFVQIQGDQHIIEINVAEPITGKEFHKALATADLPVSADFLVFLHEGADDISRDDSAPVSGLKNGARVHVTRCRHIATTVHFNEKTMERKFPPGTRVSSVKKWAAHEFGLDHKDALEHVLHLCKSTTRPSTDTPLHALTQSPECAVFFDLVPNKRVEG